jgi:hypothetical protein
MVIEKKKLVIIFYRFLLKSSFLLLCSCATSSDPGAPGFQKQYPWNFVPYTNAPWTSQVSFSDIIDLGPFYLNDSIRKNKREQDKKYGYPINALVDNSRLKY